MSVQDNCQLVLSTCPDQASARMIADQLVDRGLAACVNILPGVESIYRWEGKRESSQEFLLVIKTVSSVYEELEKVISEHHPYELPEIIGVTIQNGNKDYLGWIRENANKYLNHMPSSKS